MLYNKNVAAKNAIRPNKAVSNWSFQKPFDSLSVRHWSAKSSSAGLANPLNVSKNSPVTDDSNDSIVSSQITSSSKESRYSTASIISRVFSLIRSVLCCLEEDLEGVKDKLFFVGCFEVDWSMQMIARSWLDELCSFPLTFCVILRTIMSRLPPSVLLLIGNP